MAETAQEVILEEPENEAAAETAVEPTPEIPAEQAATDAVPAVVEESAETQGAEAEPTEPQAQESTEDADQPTNNVEQPVEGNEVKTDTPPSDETTAEPTEEDCKPEDQTESAEDQKEVAEPKVEDGNEPPVESSLEAKDEEPSEQLPIVSETLSREQTPPLTTDEGILPDEDRPEPGTPERAGSDAEQDLMLAEDELIPQYNREELLQKYQAALHEREQLNQQNYALQHKLAEYFRKKKTEEARQEVDKNVTDQEQRYMKYMSNLEELRQQQAAEQEAYNEQLEELKARKMEKHGKVEDEWTRAIEFKKAVAVDSINSRSGRPIPAKDIEIYEQNERKKEAEVSQVRLENIKLKNRLRKQELQLKQKEELAEGLHLIDFEQLKIENQTYNEKIEERNEELLKLRKKITSTVQVLTHLKEKLQFVQAENHVRKQQLSEVEQKVAKKRDVLSRTKQARDALRHDNNKLQQKCGLLGNTSLLRDYEESTDEADDLYHKLDVLKRTHAELTLNLNGIKKKIELAKETKQ
uniref:Coiled-coil domain-containing protein 96 n=1 Tax=Phallusia mammillata TaxID=59560 RepID=A0A6F9D847_9ASCI|nr:coiled-coil domain-containing protein 96 [Phallusia mammillata]